MAVIRPKNSNATHPACRTAGWRGMISSATRLPPRDAEDAGLALRLRVDAAVLRPREDVFVLLRDAPDRDAGFFACVRLPVPFRDVDAALFFVDELLEPEAVFFAPVRLPEDVFFCCAICYLLKMFTRSAGARRRY